MGGEGGASRPPSPQQVRAWGGGQLGRSWAWSQPALQTSKGPQVLTLQGDFSSPGSPGCRAWSQLAPSKGGSAVAETGLPPTPWPFHILALGAWGSGGARWGAQWENLGACPDLGPRASAKREQARCRLSDLGNLRDFFEPHFISKLGIIVVFLAQQLRLGKVSYCYSLLGGATQKMV